MTEKIIMPAVADELTEHYLTKQGFEVLTVDNPDEENILATAPDAAAVMMISNKIPNSMYDKMPNLKVLARRGVGYDNIDVNFAAKKGIWVTNTSGANAVSVAEAAVLDIMLLARKFDPISKKLRAGDWTGGYHIMGHDLIGATVGIVGFGHIGQAVAKILSSFGVKILIYNRTHYETDYGEYVDWDTLFKTADFVSLHLAAVPETKEIVNAQTLALMKPTASLINLARGAIVDEGALVDALKSKKLAGAALDVYQHEPITADNPLLALDNVFVTPHVGSNTVESNQRMAMGAVKMIEQVLRGQTPQWAVNEPKL